MTRRRDAPRPPPAGGRVPGPLPRTARAAGRCPPPANRLPGFRRRRGRRSPCWLLCSRTRAPSAASSREAWCWRRYTVRSATRRACGSSHTSGAGPSAWPQISSIREQIAAIWPRTRWAWTAPAAPVSTAAAAAASTSAPAASRRSASPSQAKASWSGVREVAAARSVRKSPTAPPNQQAATPIPPQANPGRCRYQSVPPAGVATACWKDTGPLGTPARPRLIHSAGSTVTAGCVRSTANARRPPSTCAVTTAWSSSAAKEHHGLVPDKSQAPPSLLGLASNRVPDDSAAKTPHVVPAVRCTPACARMAAASRCGSTARAAVRSSAASAARNSHRARVLPVPGTGVGSGAARRIGSRRSGSPAHREASANKGPAAPHSSWSCCRTLKALLGFTACGRVTWSSWPRPFPFSRRRWPVRRHCSPDVRA